MESMAKISDDDVRYLAQLSNLELEGSEIEPLARDIENILGYVEMLKGLDTEGVEPTYQVTDLENVWRDDVAEQGEVSREQLLSLAAASRNNQIDVPKVL